MVIGKLVIRKKMFFIYYLYLLKITNRNLLTQAYQLQTTNHQLAAQIKLATNKTNETNKIFLYKLATNETNYTNFFFVSIVRVCSLPKYFFIINQQRTKRIKRTLFFIVGLACPVHPVK